MEREVETPAHKRTRAGNRAEVFGALLEEIQEGVAHVSTQGVILYANPRFAQLFGAAPAILEDGKTMLRDFLPPECWGELSEGLQLAAREQTEGSLRIQEAESDTLRSIRLTLSPFHWKNATTIKVTAAEMTELMLKNQELQEKEESLHALSARIMQLRDEERRRIARDLHDITGQELAVVIMQLMQAAKQQRLDAEVEKGITDAASLVRKIEDEIRTLSYVLHPPLLDELGLAAALNWYVEGFSKRSGIEVKVDVAEGLLRLKKEKELALFRVVQEALTNVMRHSGSRKAQIRVTFDKQAVTLLVQDEGKGIGRKRFAKPGSGEHGVGIAGMRERLQQLGGGLEVRSLRKGTEVCAVIPIGEAEPVEVPLTEEDLQRTAKALGYKLAASGVSAAFEPQQTAALASGAPGPEAPLAGAGGTRKRVLIADDHEVTRQGIRSLLKDEKDIDVCGEAKDGLEAILMAKELEPDLIIMDLTMPGGGGFSAANRIRKSGSHPRILFFTTHQNQEIEHMARLGGFEGLVQKTEGSRDLVRGVRAVLEGQCFYGGSIVSKEDATDFRRQKASTGGA